MSVVAIILFICGAVSAYYAFKLYRISKTNKKSGFMNSESERILFNNAVINDNYTSSGRVYTRGMALVKAKNGKYDLVAQAKVCDIGLY